MSAKKKEDHIKDLVKVAIRITERYEKQMREHDELIKNSRRMRELSNEGKENTIEFRSLRARTQGAKIFNIQDDLNSLRAISNRLKRYKWD